MKKGLLTDEPELIAGIGLNFRGTGKDAEGWQHETLPAEVKAGRFQALPAKTLEQIARMQMAAQRRARPESLGWRGRGVSEDQPAQLVRLIDGGDQPVRWRIAGVSVVIATDQEDHQSRVMRSPIEKGFGEIGILCGSSMEKVAEDNQLLRSMGRDEGIEAAEGLGGGAVRDVNASRAKGRRFPEMRVSDDQCGSFSPPDRPLGEEREGG